MVDVKDVLIAVLVSYVVLDLAFTFILKQSRPLIIAHMTSVARKERRKMLLSIVIAVAAGCGAYYFVSTQL